MDTFVQISPSVHNSGLSRRRRRPGPRRAPPLRRWSTDSRKPPPPGGGGGGGGGASRAPLTPEELAWIESKRSWALSFMMRAGVSKHDAEDAVQDAFVRLLRDWASFVHDPTLPEGTARLRWIALYLFRASHRIRESRQRTERRELVPEDEPIAIDPAPRADQALSARQLLPFLQHSTSAERWRAWLAHEVDGVPVREIARQERRPAATIYNLLRCARLDFKAALRRATHSEQFQMTSRRRSK